MTDPVDVARALYAAVAAGDREAIAARLAPQGRWQGWEHGARRRRARRACAGAGDATTAMLVIGRRLPTVAPRTFHTAGGRVLRSVRWWTLPTVRDDRVVAIEDHSRDRNAVRALGRTGAAAG
jgi:hypothetical protein